MKQKLLQLNPEHIELVLFALRFTLSNLDDVNEEDFIVDGETIEYVLNSIESQK